MLHIIDCMQKHWETRVILFTAQLATIWLIIGLILKYININLIRDISFGFFLIGLPNFPTLFITILMVLLTSGMLRGHRGALLFYLLGFQVPDLLSGILFFVLGLFNDPEITGDNAKYTIIAFAVSTLFSLFYLVCGYRALKDFPARVVGSWVRALSTLIVGLIISFVVMWGVLVLQEHQDSSIAAAWSFFTAIGLSPSEPPFPTELHSPHFIRVIGGILSSVALFAAIAILFGSRRHDAATAEEQLLTRKLLLNPPLPDSLAYFSTRYDRSLITSPDEKAAVSFRVVDGVCLAAGDPLGDPESLPAAVENWREHSRKNGWVLGAASVSEAGAKAYAAAGMSVITLGDEAVVDAENFHLKNMPEVRKEIAGPRKAGYTVRVQRQSQIPAEELQHLSQLAEAWRRGDERGFTMASGRIGDPRDSRTVIVTAHDADDNVMGLLSFVPWGRRGLSLDVMRRNPDAVGGVTEFMVVGLAQEAGNLGISKFSLNFVTFREALDRGTYVAASLRERLLLKLLLLSSRWWQIQSLYQSNVKYHPQWQSRFLCIDHGFHTARVLIAFASAEGFLPWMKEYGSPVGDPQEIAALESAALMPAIEPPALSAQERMRKTKLEELESLSMSPYPPAVPRTTSIKELLAADATHTVSEAPISVTGRVAFIRDHGGVVFADLVEEHTKLQLVIERSAGQTMTLFKHLVSRGDLISATGQLGESRNGTRSLIVSSWDMAAKSLTPMPRVPLSNPHLRAKFRHMDFALNKKATDIFLARSKAVSAVRSVLQEQGYMEAETPILQTIHGGANARPFRTHIRAYDQNLTLRIAPELYLKRLVVGGIPRVFEIGRNFRNEGVDSTHNPEFTSLEAYQSYGNWDTMRVLTEELIRSAAIAVYGKPEVTTADGQILDLTGSWPVVPVYDAVSEAVGKHISPDADVSEYADIAEKYGITAATVGDLVNELYDELIEPNTVFPTFYAGFPVETSPLTMADPDQPRIAQRWDLVACGMELGTAYTELADPLEQYARLSDQSLRAAGGDAEAMELDENFLKALQFGMPPTGGLGIGIDRLVMFLTGQNIREVLSFPFVRPDTDGSARGC
ncbi:lysyl-tRNA synthetase [Corynebacterium pseudotuberculosis]|uniref:bifunctional lysylphosphatidylglycerol synthetase/lysine--tRNA ligase LysX n=1 Tax=Corynebacterium pseudotuberculosis TaxID=1719 RepID=UPI000806135D|nr:bifunctional lysylphosphatidylglycerol synthetase/lysine--tRNA ligase LysX [Corynebacterium pseudotuberculosis]ANQ78119.1 lysyl-tRNA synthetase [Corynebacterium pseudotuberculosis]